MKLTLPSGTVVELGPISGRARGFAEARRLLGSALDRDVDTLSLGDFHVLYAVLAKQGVVVEEDVEIDCFNCGEPITVAPCRSLEIAPWLDGEHDEELDVTLPFGEPHPIHPIKLGKVRLARTVTLAPLDVARAATLFDGPSLGALGIVALGKERDPERIARALDDPDALAAITPVWLDSHYVPRLHASVPCPACRARNDVDAPYDRELERVDRDELDDEFPTFDAWDEAVRTLAAPLLDEDVELVTDDGVPATDAGGDIVWGHYEEPFDEPGALTRGARITLYYRTFATVWREDGPYDWRFEIAETLEHELEHHVSFLRGHDPTAEEEDRVIVSEAVRLVGRRESQRRAVRDLGESLLEFFRRTWPLWLLLLAALAWLVATQAGQARPS